MVEMSKSKMFLGGEWVTPSTGDYFESHNPYTGKPWLMVGRGGEEDANRAVEAAKKACLLYTSPSPRDGLLSRMPSSA